MTFNDLGSSSKITLESTDKYVWELKRFGHLYCLGARVY